MKPIIVTYSNESFVITPEAWEVLKETVYGFFFQLGFYAICTGLFESDIKLIARPNK